MNYDYSSQKKPFPIIDLGDFVLREKEEGDAADFLAYYSDAEVNKYILCEIPRDEEEARKELLYWRGIFYRNQGVYFAIADKKNNRLIGSAGLTGFNSYQARIEISYDLNKDYWRQGIATKVTKALVNYAFFNFSFGRVNRIEAFVATDNFPSQQLLLKNGFLFEGILREHRYHRGKYVDVAVFSLLRREVKK